MRIVRIKEKVAHNGILRIHPIGDLHVGAPDFDEAGFLYRRSLIEGDSDARWTYGGDGGDLIRFNDRRYSPTELAPAYRQATDMRHATMEHLLKLLDPIKDKCLCIGDGNHERKVDEFYGGHFGVELACNLGLQDRFVDYRGFVSLEFTIGGRAILGQLIDIQHGWQAGRSRGAFANQAEKELGFTDADIVLRGHSHRPDGHVFKTLGANINKTRPTWRYRTVINWGSWRAGMRDDLRPINPDKLSEVERSMWSEAKGFRNEFVGGPVLLLRFDKGQSGRKPEHVHRSASISHSKIDGEINEHSLGL